MTYKLNVQKSFNYNLNKNNNDDKYGILKFSSCHDKYPIYELKKDELKAFLNFAKLFESLLWREIKIYPSFKFENIPQLKKPDSIDRDIILSSLRVTDKFRLIGYRHEECFYIVWFDKNHETYKG